MAQNGLTPVSRARHGNRFWRRFTSFKFVCGLTDCPVVNAELLQTAATFPIVFRVSDRGYYPVAILSMVSGDPTPFVSVHGRWQAAYVPSALRCFPFQCQSLTSLGDSQAPCSELLIDESSGLVTDNPEDEVFFDQSGALGPELKKVGAFFQALTKSMQETFHLCHILAEMKLFSPLDSYQNTALPKGCFGVDMGALRRVPAAHMSLLAINGALRLIHAHQISLTHISWLSQAQKRSDSFQGLATDKTTSDLTGFLDALVTAQEQENRLGQGRRGGEYAIL